MIAILAALMFSLSPQEVAQPPLLNAQVPSQDEVARASIQAQMDIAEIGAVLDRMHDAASRADGDVYFNQFSLAATFIGTDVTERWNMVQFRAYAQPYFDQGRGWTYIPRPDRTIQLYGDWALFDEVLDHSSYGVMRGSGALHRGTDGWKIEQYVLSFAVPNDRAREVVEVIKADPAE